MILFRGDFDADFAIRCRFSATWRKIAVKLKAREKEPRAKKRRGSKLNERFFPSRWKELCFLGGQST